MVRSTFCQLVSSQQRYKKDQAGGLCVELVPANGGNCRGERILILQTAAAPQPARHPFRNVPFYMFHLRPSTIAGFTGVLLLLVFSVGRGRWLAQTGSTIGWCCLQQNQACTQMSADGCRTQGGFSWDAVQNRCDLSCGVFPCGNRIRNAGEECDDGNTVGCDGCSSSCLVERGWQCRDASSVPSSVSSASLVSGIQWFQSRQFGDRMVTTTTLTAQLYPGSPPCSRYVPYCPGGGTIECPDFAYINAQAGFGALNPLLLTQTCAYRLPCRLNVGYFSNVDAVCLTDGLGRPQPGCRATNRAGQTVVGLTTAICRPAAPPPPRSSSSQSSASSSVQSSSRSSASSSVQSSSRSSASSFVNCTPTTGTLLATVPLDAKVDIIATGVMNGIVYHAPVNKPVRISVPQGGIAVAYKGGAWNAWGTSTDPSFKRWSNGSYVNFRINGVAKKMAVGAGGRFLTAQMAQTAGLGVFTTFQTDAGQIDLFIAVSVALDNANAPNPIGPVTVKVFSCISSSSSSSSSISSVKSSSSSSSSSSPPPPPPAPPSLPPSPPPPPPSSSSMSSVKSSSSSSSSSSISSVKSSSSSSSSSSISSVKSSSSSSSS